MQDRGVLVLLRAAPVCMGAVQQNLKHSGIKSGLDNWKANGYPRSHELNDRYIDKNMIGKARMASNPTERV
jgi:hypothetical protein